MERVAEDMKSAQKNARLGFLLSPEDTEKVHILSNHMETTPQQLIVGSIERLWQAYLKLMEDSYGKR